MPRWQYLVSFLLSRLVDAGDRGCGLSGFCVAGLWSAVSRVDVAIGISLRAHFVRIFRTRAAGASRAKTMEAASGLMNLVMLPMWILSGVFFSARRFPAVIQPVVRALPLTAAIDALRGNMLQGMNLGQLTAKW